MVLPSAKIVRVSLRTVLGPTATAPSAVHVITSLFPSHALTVWLGPPLANRSWQASWHAEVIPKPRSRMQSNQTAAARGRLTPLS
jgi:hypothetical protein